MFPNLTVESPATAANHGAATPWTMDAIFDMFPRRGGGTMANLLGGEQQMPDIGRALMTNPTS